MIFRETRKLVVETNLVLRRMFVSGISLIWPLGILCGMFLDSWVTKCESSEMRILKQGDAEREEEEERGREIGLVITFLSTPSEW